MSNEQTSFFDMEEKNEENLEKIELKINKLREQIIYYNKKYYEDDNPEITDYAYDKLTRELRKLEEKYPQFATSDSPTKKVGGKSNKIFTPVSHEVQMQSLQDVFSFEEVEDFVDKVKMEFGENTELVVETKIDGLSVSLEYQDGVLVRGSTRGDGYVGEDVTQNVMMIADIPQKLKSNDTVEIRGEVYLPREEFEKINNKLLESRKSSTCKSSKCCCGYITSAKC